MAGSNKQALLVLGGRGKRAPSPSLDNGTLLGKQSALGVASVEGESCKEMIPIALLQDDALLLLGRSDRGIVGESGRLQFIAGAIEDGGGRLLGDFCAGEREMRGRLG